MVKVKVVINVNNILIRILYLKQQNIVLWCFRSLKFKYRLISCKLFSHTIFYIKGIVNTTEKIQVKYFVQN